MRSLEHRQAVNRGEALSPLPIAVLTAYWLAPGGLDTSGRFHEITLVVALCLSVAVASRGGWRLAQGNVEADSQATYQCLIGWVVASLAFSMFALALGSGSGVMAVLTGILLAVTLWLPLGTWWRELTHSRADR